MIFYISIFFILLYLLILIKNKNQINLKKNDVILITGGNGDWAFKIIEEFSINNKNSNIIIISLDIINNKNDLIIKLCNKNGWKFKFYKTDLNNIKELEFNLLNIKKKYGIPKVIINNAAIVKMEYANKINFDNILKEININGISHLFLIKYFLNDMIEKKNEEFIICNICSIVGFIPGLNIIGYSSSKFLMRGFHLNLRLDLKKWKINNIKTIIIFPYLFNSKLFSQLNIKYNIFESILIPKLNIKFVAKKIYHSIINKKEEVVIPFKFKLYNFIFNLLPCNFKDLILLKLTKNLVR